MKIAVICLNLTMNAYIKWRTLVFLFSINVRIDRFLNVLFSSRDKIQPPLQILPVYIELSSHILAPEYVSIYVKYCYLDTLTLLIQMFLELTPG